MAIFTLRLRLAIKNDDTGETFSIPLTLQKSITSPGELLEEFQFLVDALKTRLQKKADLVLLERELEKPEADIDQFVEGAS